MLFSALQATGVAAASSSREALDGPALAPYLTGLSRLRYWIGRPYSAAVKASSRSVRNALRSIAAESTTNEGTLTLKVMWFQLRSILLNHGLSLNCFGAPITWVRIRRIDRLQQAVSAARAQQTQRWSADLPEIQPPTYNADDISFQLARLKEEDENWDAYLAAIGATPLQITYEELDADYEGTVRKVLDYIGAPTAVIPPQRLSRQADHLNAEWIERYLSTHPGSKGD